MKTVSIYFKERDIELYNEILKVSQNSRLSLNQTIMKILEEYVKGKNDA